MTVLAAADLASRAGNHGSCTRRTRQGRIDGRARKHAFARAGLCLDRRRGIEAGKPQVALGKRGCAVPRSVGVEGYYDPTTGTFLSRDPLGEPPGTTVEANPYSYARNDPVNMVDPLGLRAKDPQTLLIVATEAADDDSTDWSWPARCAGKLLYSTTHLYYAQQGWNALQDPGAYWMNWDHFWNSIPIVGPIKNWNNTNDPADKCAAVVSIGLTIAALAAGGVSLGARYTGLPKAGGGKTWQLGEPFENVTANALESRLPGAIEGVSQKVLGADGKVLTDLDIHGRGFVIEVTTGIGKGKPGQLSKNILPAAKGPNGLPATPAKVAVYGPRMLSKARNAEITKLGVPVFNDFNALVAWVKQVQGSG